MRRLWGVIGARSRSHNKHSVNLRPELPGAPFAPAGIALVTVPPAGTRPQLSFRLDVHAPSPGLACGEIAKG